LITEADTILGSDISWNQTTVAEVTKAYYTKLLAAAYAFSDTSAVNHDSYGTEAAQALYYIPGSSYKSQFPSDLEISESATYWAEAYDMLKGAGFDFATTGISNMESAIRDKFSDLRDYMAYDWDENFFGSSIQRDFLSVAYFDTLHTDNHHIKLNGALTVLSLTIYSESGSSSDYSRGQSRLRDSLGNMTVTGDNGEAAGGWVEGPRYHRYSLRQYLPAVTALNNLNILGWSDFTELDNTHLLLPKLVMPDGYMPPTDDNEAVVFDPAGLLYSVSDRQPEHDMLHWLWEMSGSSVTNTLLPDYLAQYDDTPPAYNNPVEMGWDTSGFFPESGFARFRSSWEADAVYMLMLTEHGEARINGQAHEHPDPNALLLHAYGDMLLLDSGYGGWGENDSTRFAGNHNIILVDGEGPDAASQGSSNYWDANGTDAYLSEYFTSNGLDYARSQTLYRNTIFQRAVVFPYDRYFLVYDTMSGNEDHTYTLLLHGNGGGTSDGTFTLSEPGGLWAREKSVLLFRTVGSSGLLFDSEDMNHAVYSRTPMLTHTVLKVSLNGREESFLTLLFPERSGTTLPELSQANTTSGTGIQIVRGDTTDVACMSSADSLIIVESGTKTFSSDGEFVFVSTRSDTTVNQVYFIGGSYLASGQDTLISTSASVNMSSDYRFSPGYEGYIQTNQATETVIHGVSVSNVAQVLFDNESISFSGSDNSVSFTAAGDGAWKVEMLYTFAPPSGIQVSDVGSDHGYSTELTWTLSTSESDGTVEWYRIYRSRSTSLADIRPLTDFSVLDSLLVWEEQNTVLVDSVAAGTAQFTDTTVPLNNTSFYYWIQAVGTLGVSEKIPAGSILTDVNENLSPYTIDKPYPNPFNASTQLPYYLPHDTHVVISIYDILGRKTAVIEDSFMSAGYHEAVWNGKTVGGLDAGTGMYLYHFQTKSFEHHGKLMLLR
ncbi:heparinase II/III family protein, partial [Candidatus Latescibacterota bacterium]